MNEETVLVSVVTVCRNAVLSIRRTVESVRAQEGVPGAIEHIVVDGVSTDGTLDVLAEYPHLKVTSEPDAGLYDAMNKGVSKASGDIVGILNADDWYEAGALARVVRTFVAAPDVGIVHGDERIWRGERAVRVVKPPLSRPLGAVDALLLPVNHPATFVRRDVYRRCGGFDLRYRTCADYDWIRRVQAAGVQFEYLPHILTNFSIGGVSTFRFLVGERYRVRRAHGAGRLAAAAWVARTCLVVAKNRFVHRVEAG